MPRSWVGGLGTIPIIVPELSFSSDYWSMKDKQYLKPYSKNEQPGYSLPLLHSFSSQNHPFPFLKSCFPRLINNMCSQLSPDFFASDILCLTLRWKMRILFPFCSTLCILMSSESSCVTCFGQYLCLIVIDDLLLVTFECMMILFWGEDQLP